MEPFVRIREYEEIELERVMMMIEAVRNNDPPLLEADLKDFSGKKVDAPQHLADRIHNRREIQVAGCDLVKHGREQEEVLAINEGNLDGR